MRRLALRGRYHCGLLQTEFQQGFAGHFHLLTAGEHLHSASCSGADAGSNGCTFAATGNRTDDRAESRAPADLLRGVGTAPLALQRVIAAYERIVVSIYDHARELELQLGAAANVARFFGFSEATIDVCAFPRDQGAVNC